MMCEFISAWAELTHVIGVFCIFFNTSVVNDAVPFMLYICLSIGSVECMYVE